MKILSAIFTFLVSWMAVASSNVVHLDKLDSFPLNVQKVAKALKALPENSVLLLGEDHRDIYGKKLLSHAIRLIDTSAPNEIARCHFVERDQSYQVAFDLLSNNFNGARVLYQEIFDRNAVLFREVFGREPSNWTDFDNLGVISGTGRRVYAVDATGEDWMRRFQRAFSKVSKAGASEGDLEAFNTVAIVERNLIMAMHINRLFSNGDCQSASLSVGAAHLRAEKGLSGKASKNLQDYLQVPFQTVEISECQAEKNCQDEEWANLSIRIE